MIRGWEADPSSPLVRRLGKSPAELGTTGGEQGCPDIWELENGDIAVVGRDLTDSYLRSLPPGLVVAPDERIVVIPRRTAAAAKGDLPDA
ncbi:MULTISPECIES: hypothetical protein [unclassified Streptomyces]|uniref:hypothetical protein n=1 Tax=unclassified Streptomyces TaxID=2593676 RepID=UPI0003647905|nr:MULTISPECIES: hypothetical protein [unclassified Streptomyces]MYY02685.1 hypothetical protein [Streptomyces sp. SID4913]